MKYDVPDGFREETLSLLPKIEQTVKDVEDLLETEDDALPTRPPPEDRPLRYGVAVVLVALVLSSR